jgi:hypothetical protein
MLSLLNAHRRLAIGGAVAAVILAAGGTTLALHASSASTAATSAATSPPPATGTLPKPPPARAAARRTVVARLVAATPSALTVATPSGAQTTYTVTPRTRVTGPGHTTETLSSIPAGEVVLVVSTGGPHGGKVRAGAQRATSPATGATAVRPLTAVSVEDTGFAAR